MAPHAEETTAASTENVVPVQVNPAKIAAAVGGDKSRQVLIPVTLNKEAELEGKNGKAPAKVCLPTRLPP